jgi:hypothetical protein
MRRLALSLFAVAAAGCHPSSTIQNTMPIANLNTYSTVGLRVKSAMTRGYNQYLEAAVAADLRAKCGFSTIGPVGQSRPDVLIDLNIMQLRRGGDSRFIQNPNEAVMDTLVVLTDGQTNELIGTSRVHASSSGMAMGGGSPEQEVISESSKAITDQLAKSGCAGPRVARAVEAPPLPLPPTPGSAAPDESHRAEADELNKQGTEKLQGADAPGALAAFQQANQLVPDPKYVFNACLALETEEQWDQAIGACKMAKTMNPSAALATKIDHRLDVLAHHQ